MRGTGWLALPAAACLVAVAALPVGAVEPPATQAGPAGIAELVQRIEADRAALADIDRREAAAWRAASLLAPAARVAQEVADDQQAALDVLARTSYMHGQPTTTQLILESDSTSVSDAIQGITYQHRVADDKIERTAAALDVAEGRHDAYLQAANEAYAAAAERVHTRLRLASNLAALTEQAAAAGPATAQAMTAFASIDDTGCPTVVPDAALVGLTGVDITAVCQQARAQATTPRAAAAIAWAFSRLGSPYACKGAGREGDFRYDCSSLVGRAYEAGAGVATRAGAYLPTTATMLAVGHPTWQELDPAALAPGDLALYDTCPRPAVEAAADGDVTARTDAADPAAAAATATTATGFPAPAADATVTTTPSPVPSATASKPRDPDDREPRTPPCRTRHVVMYLGVVDGRELMLHTNRCGGVANVTEFWGTEEDGDHGVYLAARRVATG